LGFGGGYGIENGGLMDTGNGDDTIIGTNTGPNSLGWGIANGGDIITGDGNDMITGIGTTYGIFFFNNNGTINAGNGNDSIIADGGVEDFIGSGRVFLGNGKDYLKGFGSGDFNGGNGKDTLELKPGSYTVGISGTAVNFTKGSTIMKTFDFEILIAGNTTYGIPSLIDGQTIIVA
jgi:hypothetical protein